jgi:AcrR family transcriptional regulator
MDETLPTEILDATYRSLCIHGYANLTLEKIAAET